VLEFHTASQAVAAAFMLWLAVLASDVPADPPHAASVPPIRHRTSDWLILVFKLLSSIKLRNFLVFLFWTRHHSTQYDTAN